MSQRIIISEPGTPIWAHVTRAALDLLGKAKLIQKDGPVGVDDGYVIVQGDEVHATETGAAMYRRWLASAQLQHDGVLYMTEEAWRAAGGGAA